MKPARRQSLLKEELQDYSERSLLYAANLSKAEFLFPAT